MTNSNITTSSLAIIDQKLDILIRRSQDLKRKNAALEAIQNSLMDERSQIAEKNNVAQSKLEVMINQLREVEES